jgi:hypothetical protein
VYAWVTVRLRLPGVCFSSSRAGAVDAGKPSALGKGVGLNKEAVWRLVEGPAGQGVLTLFAPRRSCALSSLPAI